ncbi:hypothetical protein ScPMuIL_015236 [Solemya velum]
MAQMNWNTFLIGVILFIFCKSCSTIKSEISYKVDSPSIHDSVILVDDAGRYKRQVSNPNTTVPPDTTTEQVARDKKTEAVTRPNQQEHTTSGHVQDQDRTLQPGIPTVTTPKLTTPYPLNIINDSHKYYNFSVIQSQQELFWYEMKDALNHDALTDSHRVAVVVKLKFKFPFYGHSIINVTIATGGFLYMSPFLHQWLTATQYIAPLMANFDTRIGNTSDIYYKDYGDKLVVEWRNVHLRDQNYTEPFSFQTILHENGSITFVYRNLPLVPERISTLDHPVKIGLSDAYYIDSVVYGYKRRTIYEYHRVALPLANIKTGAVVFLNPLTTCNVASDCYTCVSQKIGFDCTWCPQISRCSDGLDWHRQEWLEKGCLDLDGNEDCPSAIPVGVIVAVVLLLVAVIGGISAWCIYAYKNPQSASGQWLISHRPSQMKETVAKMKFWKKSTPSGEKYRLETEA